MSMNINKFPSCTTSFLPCRLPFPACRLSCCRHRPADRPARQCPPNHDGGRMCGRAAAAVETRATGGERGVSRDGSGDMRHLATDISAYLCRKCCCLNNAYAKYCIDLLTRQQCVHFADDVKIIVNIAFVVGFTWYQIQKRK